MIVGIDNPGPMRSLNYLPYAPGSGTGSFRGDAARWPGGGVEQYMSRLIHEIMPLVVDKYNLATDPAKYVLLMYGGGVASPGLSMRFYVKLQSLDVYYYCAGSVSEEVRSAESTRSMRRFTTRTSLVLCWPRALASGSQREGSLRICGRTSKHVGKGWGRAVKGAGGGLLSLSTHITRVHSSNYLWKP